MNDLDYCVFELTRTPDLTRCQSDVRQIEEDTTDFRCPDPASHTYTDEYGTHSVCEGCKVDADRIVAGWKNGVPIKWTPIQAQESDRE
jgi:Zn finger protein HypA/HybF involved in hydrogenase expression